jgi:hypothetical protein
MSATVQVFVFTEDEEIQVIRVFKDPDKALKFAIPYVAEKVGYKLTGDDNVDWDILNTEIDHPDCGWLLKYDVSVD